MSGADFTRTCEGCEYIVTEEWSKGRTRFGAFTRDKTGVTWSESRDFSRIFRRGVRNQRR